MKFHIIRFKLKKKTLNYLFTDLSSSSLHEDNNKFFTHSEPKTLINYPTSNNLINFI